MHVDELDESSSSWYLANPTAAVEVHLAVLGLHDLDAFGDVSVVQRRGRVGELVGLDDPKRSNTRASGGQQQGGDGGGQRQHGPGVKMTTNNGARRGDGRDGLEPWTRPEVGEGAVDGSRTRSRGGGAPVWRQAKQQGGDARGRLGCGTRKGDARTQRVDGAARCRGEAGSRQG